jgi:FemAB-related protein (PEP-CTERM system-associated)
MATTHLAYRSLADRQLSAPVRALAEETFFCDEIWLDLLARLYGYSPMLLTSTNSSGLVSGLLPLCYMQSPITGRRLVSLPFSDHCPLLAEDEDSANDLIDQAVRLARDKKVRYLELRTGLSDSAGKRPELLEGNLYVRWVFSLTADTDAMWNSLRKPVQKRVKRSRRLGVDVRLADQRRDIDTYYRLHLLVRSRKHGMPPQSIQFFYALWDTFHASGKLQLLLAEQEGRVIAAMILLGSGKTMRCAYSASDDAHLNLAPNNLLFWKSMEWSGAHGYETLDFGRTARDNQGLMDFKQRWGATMEPLPYYYYPRISGLATTSENSWKFQLMTNLWRKLPLPVAGVLGGYLYPHLG